MTMDLFMQLLRMALLAGGSALASRGIGDAPMWEAITGGILAIGGAIWMRYARKQALAHVPPEVQAQLKAQSVAETVKMAARS
jgi:hypothetical protein